MKDLLHPDLKNPGSKIVRTHYEDRTVITMSGVSITVYRPERDGFNDNKIKLAYINASTWNADTTQEALDQLVATAYAVRLMTEWNELLSPPAESAGDPKAK